MNKHYFDEFVKLKCAPDLLIRNIYPNSKEISESFGAYHAVKNYIVLQCGAALNDNTIALVAPGDGRTPRTAALFAFRSAWTCYSIDPALRDKDWKIDRLICLKRKVEDAILDLSNFSQTIVVLVHSHTTIKDVLRGIKAKKLHIVSIQCCVPHEIPNVPYIGYVDTAIWSPKNTVKIWKDVDTNLYKEIG